ncbi:hypothetical protein L0337_07945 [candidate division KSB1 bacterium]|nr:hypothetical protein [candidate division KSB1 bacterium]
MKNSALIAFVRIYNTGHLPLQYRIKVNFTKLFFKKFTSTTWGKYMSNSAWFNREKTKKQERDHRRDFEHCYKKLLHGNISTAINSATKKIEETLY